MKDGQISYGDLTIPLKLGIVAAWIVGVIYIIAFLYGFMAAMAGA